MTALQCEICGGRLTAKSGGIFECDFCGMQYDKTRVQEMVQEIKGTVKVEGTVEVTGKVQIEGGTVKVEGGTSAENFVKRGNMALADEKWEDAEKFFDDALNLDAECAEAYLGKLMAELEVSRKEDLKEEEEPFDGNSNYKKAMRFGDEHLKAELAGYLESVVQNYKRQLEEEMRARERQLEEEKRAREREREKATSG